MISVSRGWNHALLDLMVVILQWNAQSLLANEQEFKQFIVDMQAKPDVICVQETWLKSNVEFIIQGYVVVWRDRDVCVGGTLIKQGLPYRMLGEGIEQEYVVEV